MTPVELAVIELTQAREAVREAKDARRAIKRDLGGCVSTESIPCYDQPDVPLEEWCASCRESQPAHLALHKASRRARSAMLRVLGFGRRLQKFAKAPNGDPFTLPLFEDPPNDVAGEVRAAQRKAPDAGG